MTPRNNNIQHLGTQYNVSQHYATQHNNKEHYGAQYNDNQHDVMMKVVFSYCYCKFRYAKSRYVECRGAF